MKIKLRSTRNNLPENSRRAMIGLLNQELASGLDLTLQTKQAHWNFKGPHFIGLQQLFDDVAEGLAKFTDGMAERAVALGGTALEAIQFVSRNSRLADCALDLISGREHLTALAETVAAFGAGVRQTIDIAAKADDADTAILFTEISRGVDKRLWLLEAHLQAKE